MNSRQLVQRGALPHAIVTTVLNIAHSVRARGVRRTALFAAAGIIFPAVGEYSSVNIARVLRHHSRPQVKGVPLIAVLGWYNIGYATFAMLERIVVEASAERRRWLLPALTALIATDLDLILDCFGLDQGFWEWNADGRYASDIVGSNGRHGIPFGNFVGWVMLTGGVTSLYGWIAGDDRDPDRSGGAGSGIASRTAALLLLPYYLGSLGWAIRERRWRPIVYSALVPGIILVSIVGNGKRSQ